MKKCVKIMTMLQKCDNILKNNQLQKSMKIAFFYLRRDRSFA